MKRLLVFYVIGLVLCAAVAQAEVSLIKNGSFEMDGSIPDITVKPPNYWQPSIPAGKYSAFVGSQGATHRDFALTFQTAYGVDFEPGVLATVAQDVFTDDVNQISFDLELTTSYPDYFDWDSNLFSVIVAVDGNIIWDSNQPGINQNGQYYIEVNDVNIPGGPHTLALGIKANSTATYYYSYYARWDFVKFDTYCGGFGYLPEDLNHDCYVSFDDYALLAQYWLQEAPGWEYDLAENGDIDIYDIDVFAAGWLDNSDWRNWGDDNCYEAELLETDLNFDGIVDFADFAILAGNWQLPGEGDIDGSGTVDFEDLAAIAEQWTFKDWIYGAN